MLGGCGIRLPLFASPKREIPPSPVVIALCEAANRERRRYLSRYRARCQRPGVDRVQQRKGTPNISTLRTLSTEYIGQCRSQPSVSTLGAIEGEISQGDGGGVFGLPLLWTCACIVGRGGSPSDGATDSATREEDKGGTRGGRGGPGGAQGAANARWTAGVEREYCTVTRNTKCSKRVKDHDADERVLLPRCEH
jgi:hypothetical protein